MPSPFCGEKWKAGNGSMRQRKRERGAAEMLEVKGQNILLTRGDTAALTLTLEGDYVPDGTEMKFTIKKAPTDSRALVMKTVETESNRAVLALEPGDTRQMQPGQYVYDVRVKAALAEGAAGTYTPMIYGVFQLLDNVGA